MFTIYELIDYIIDGNKCEIFDTETGNTIFEGYPDEIPEHLQDAEVSSFEGDKNKIIFNI